MGTKAYIVIKVDDKDLNKKIQFDPSKMPWPVQIHPNQKSPLPEVIITGKYLVCYNLLDSYPDYLGKELKKNYNTYENVLNLCAGGVYDTIVGVITMDRKELPEGEHCIKNSLACSTYTWDLNKPVCFPDLATLDNDIAHSIMHYAYRFENGQWFYKTVPHNKWARL